MKIKAVLIEKEEYASDASTLINLELYPLADGNAENKAAFRYTPHGCIKLCGLTPEAGGAFVPGQHYFIDITPAG